MTEFLIILGCAVGFVVMGLLTRGMAHHEHAHHEHGHHDHDQYEPHDPTEKCGGCSLNCETTERSDV